MKLGFNQFLAVVYADLFDWSLTKEEARIWEITTSIRKRENLTERDNYLFLNGRKSLVPKRRLRENESLKKLAIAFGAIDWLGKIPTVSAVFLTGSAAAKNAKPEADVDLLVVTVPGAMWLTRLMVVSLLRWRGIYKTFRKSKNKICTNIFLNENNLEIKNHNLYTAHEVAQAVCLFDRGNIEQKWLTENRWVKGFLPKVTIVDLKNEKKKTGLVYIPMELVAFIIQYLYMRKKITREKIGWGFAFFHPNDLSKMVFEKFKKKLVKFGYNANEIKKIFFH